MEIEWVMKGWETLLNDKNLLEIENYLDALEDSGAMIYPAAVDMYKAFQTVALDDVKVVILGQDPYHTPGIANGLAFSVYGDKIPPSLKNIYKELQSDVGCSIPAHGDLTKWAEQGVLLLNAALTVEEGDPGSHMGLWREFIIKVLTELQSREIPTVLWGAKAIELYDSTDFPYNPEILVCSAHPSPFSADRGFFGSKPFSRVNELLIAQGETPIDWSLPEFSDLIYN